MTRFLKGTDRPLAEAYQLALLDLDGVVYRGKNPVEYAADSIRAAEAAGMTIEYTTNNSSRFQHVVADQLKGFGLDVEPWQVITSSVVAARMVAKALPAGARVQVLGAEHLRDEVTRNGLTIVDGPQDRPQAVIQGWYPGAVGGKAIANILFGDVSPEGKLPLTFYHSIDDLPEFTDYSMKGRTYRYMKQDAMYPFGYGLSYNEYELSNVKADREVLTEDGITVTAEISNLGEYDSAETVQVYVKICAEDTPNAQLKGLKKVSLKKGEKKRVEIHLPKEAFGLYDEEGKLCYQEGEAICYVGTNGPDHRSVELTGKKPAEITIKVPADC